MSSQEYILELAMQISKTHKRIIACNRIYAESAWSALVCTNMCHPLHGIFLKKSLWWWTYFQCLTVTLAPSTTAMYHSVPTWRPRTSPGDLLAKTMFIWLSVYLFWSRKMSRCAVCLLLLHKFEVNVKLRTLIHVHVVAILAGTLPNTWTSTIQRTLLSSALQKEKVQE